MNTPEFDKFVSNYEQLLARPCALSGESPDFYSLERMLGCRERLSPWLPFQTAMDLGCGTSGSIGHFFSILGCRRVIAMDPSGESLRIAGEKHPGLNVLVALNA